jgi:uncharacterized phiE125 gp8 family phage protein
MSFTVRERYSLTGAWTPQINPIDTRITVPAVELPLTVAEAMSFLRIYDVQDADFLGMLLSAITDQVERYIGSDTQLKTRQSYWERTGGYVVLPYGPHGAVTSVVSRDEDNVDTTLVAGTDYVVEGMGYKKIRFYNKTGGQILATYQSGYTNCPDAIRGAILQELSFQYKNRQDPNTPSRISVNGLTLEARQLLLSYMRNLA